jgi:hypothetical protein
MLRQILRLVNRVSPSFGRVLHEAWYTLSGWRFHDVKRHLDARLASSLLSQAAFTHSIATLRAEAPRGPRIAYVSNLPPETTGIASCSFYSFLGSHEAIDLFCPVTDADWFFANDLQLRQGGSDGPRLLDAQAFLTADRLHAYQAIVIAVGNSDHCTYLHEILRKAEALDGSLERVVFHVHDPFVLNLIEKGSGLSPTQLVAALTEGDQPAALREATAAGDVHGNLARAGISGMRFFANLGVRRFLTNSQAASAILRQELAGLPVRIDPLYHPVFLPIGVHPPAGVPADHPGGEPVRQPGGEPASQPGETLTIGSFGYPGGDKMTDRVIDAVRLLHDAGHRVRLLLAGFATAQFANAHQGALAGLEVELLEGPSDPMLCRAMQACDVAVQLRAENRGESSGTVSLLIALEKRIIAADVGAFSEYGPAVRLVPARPDAATLAAAILAAMREPPPLAALRAYHAARTPARFRAELLAALGCAAPPAQVRPLILAA